MSWSFTIRGHAADAPTEEAIRNACHDLARRLATDHPGNSEGSSFEIVERSGFVSSHGHGWLDGDEATDPVRLETARQAGAQAAADQALRDQQAAEDAAAASGLEDAQAAAADLDAAEAAASDD